MMVKTLAGYVFCAGRVKEVLLGAKYKTGNGVLLERNMVYENQEIQAKQCI